MPKGDKICPACGTKVVRARKSKPKDEPLPDTQPVSSGMPAEVTEQPEPSLTVSEQVEAPVEVTERSEPPPTVSEQVEVPVEVVEPDGKQKKRKREPVDYEALLMANMPEKVQRRMPIVTFALIGVSVLFAIIMLCATGSFNPDPQEFIDYGANYRRLTFGGQLWRLVTSSFLHFGLLSLAFNMLCLFAIGRFLEKMVGHASLLCVYLLTACTGGALSLCFYDDAVCAGASGAVFGVFGASITLVALLWRKYRFAPKHMWGYMKNGLAFVGINFIYSLFPGIDMAGHIGGLLGGLVVGAILAVPLLMEGKPFGKWFQRGFWGVSALVAATLACTIACESSANGYGGSSSSRSDDRDNSSSTSVKKVPRDEVSFDKKGDAVPASDKAADQLNVMKSKEALRMMSFE